MKDNKFMDEQGTDTGTDQNKTPGIDGNSYSKTFTQDDIDTIIAKRLASQKKKFDKEMKDKLDEIKRLLKLDEEERAQKLKSQKDKELAICEQKLTLRERKLEAIDKLAEINIPISLVDFVVNSDADVMEENIIKLEKAFNKAVSKAVNTRLKGYTPKDFNKYNKKEVQRGQS